MSSPKHEVNPVHPSGLMPSDIPLPSAGRPTPKDMLDAGSYSRQLINMLKCGNTYIQSLHDNSIQWDTVEANYRCPLSWQNLEGKCPQGRCRINNHTLCNALSFKPFDDAGKGADPAEIKGPYLEWRKYTSPTGEESGRCVFGNSSLRKWCEFPETRSEKNEHGMTDVPEFKYLCDPDDCPGACIITKPYCDWMGVSFKGDGTDSTCYTPGYQAFFEFVIGKTLFRNMSHGNTYMGGNGKGWGKAGEGIKTGLDYTGLTPGLEFIGSGAVNAFRQSNDDNSSFATWTKSGGGGMNGTGIDIGVTNTVQNKKLNTKELYKSPTQIKKEKEFRKGVSQGKYPYKTTVRLVDKKEMGSYKILAKDFGGVGINLYIIKWKLSARKLDRLCKGSNIGFLGNEIDKKYPEIIFQHHGNRYLFLDRDKSKTDKNLARIHFISNSGIWTSKFITNLINKYKK